MSGGGGAQRAGLKIYGWMPPKGRQRFVRAGKPAYTVGTMAVVTRADGAVLLVRHSYLSNWSLPGGLLNRRELIEVGTARFTAFMRELGMSSTYMQSGYDAQVQYAPLPTPGNQRTEWNTNPDSNLQTTTAEMGRIMAAIYRCAQGDGLLIATFGDRITPDECRTILFYMSHDEFQEMVWAGLPRPENAWIVHKHGFAYESHSDVALVWGPTGPYSISIFLWSQGWMNWFTSNTTMKTISRITWNYFDFERQHQGLETPVAFILEPPPGYTRLHDYIKVASTGYR